VAIRAGELWGFADGVLDLEDHDPVHDMRVASRRLRAVLEIYAPCFPAADLQDVLADVKALADALGERRDPDVELEALDAFAASAGAAAQPGLDEYRRRLAERQRAANETLAAALQAAQDEELAARLQALARTADPEAVVDGPDAVEAVADGPIDAAAGAVEPVAEALPVADELPVEEALAGDAATSDPFPSQEPAS
jgi:CHAD domain-containing protein